MTVLSLNRQPKREEPVELSPMDRRVESSRRIPVYMAWLVAAGVLLIVAAVIYWRYGLTSSVTVPAERVRVAVVRTGVFSDYIPLTGSVQPIKTVYLDVVEGGQVAEKFVEEGASVTAGQVLVRLTNVNLELDMVGRESQIAEQIASLGSVRLSFEQNRLAHQRQLAEVETEIARLSEDIPRRRALLKEGFLGPSTVRDLERELEKQQRIKESTVAAITLDERFRLQQGTKIDDAIELLRANLKLTHDSRSNLLVTAPIAGELTQLDAERGQSLTRNQRVGQIDQTDGYKVSAEVDEFYLGRVTIGQEAHADIDGISQRFTVTKIYPQVRDRRFKIDLGFDATPPKSLRRGQSLQMKLAVGAEKKSILMPNGSFYDETGGQWVFVLSPTGQRAEQRNVKFGRRNPEDVEIIEGLAVGERVIVSSYEEIKRFELVDLRGVLAD